MKKIVLILLLIFFTGCDITYNLEINDRFIENIIIKEQAAGEDDNELKMRLETGIPLYFETDYGKKYDVESNKANDLMTLSIRGSFPLSNTNSNAIYTACNNYEFKDNEDSMSITASDFKLFDDYPYLNSITVNVKCKKNVLKNNADKVRGNTYTWIINSDNYDSKIIKLSFSNEKSLIAVSEDSPMIRFSIILLSIVMTLTIIILCVKVIFKRKNSI